MSNENVKRCSWVTDEPVHVEYHDKEWCVPIYDDQKLYEMLVLESFQSGLSWLIILRKRENFRKVFDNFDSKKIANYDEKKIEELSNDEGIIRSPRKISATVNNTKVFHQIQDEYGSFSKYIWGFTDNKIIDNITCNIKESQELATRVSKDLKKRGMKYVGNATIYAYLETIGMINNHEKTCFLHAGKK